MKKRTAGFLTAAAIFMAALCFLPAACGKQEIEVPEVRVLPAAGRLQEMTEKVEEEIAAAEPEPEGAGVLEAVWSLPEDYRIPVHLFYYEGMSVAEIAQALGKREGAIRTRLFRARTMLRDKLREEGNYV